MAGEDNLERTKKAYAAFQSGDAAGAMADMADDIEWIVAGNSAISGTYRGKEEVGGLWGKFLEHGLQTNPQYWFSDEDRVVVLTQVTLAGEQSDQADVLTFRDGQLVKFQSAGDTALAERVYGTK